MNYNFYYLFLLFFSYAVLGYFIESSTVSIDEKKVNLSRGFLIGPYLPIFGFGGLIMYLVLDKYKGDYLTLFINSMVLCLLLEYISSYLLEKIFKLKWWNYSNRKFNINGRICLENGIWFGLLGLLSIEVLNNIIFRFLNSLSFSTIKILSIILLIIMLIDFGISLTTIIKFKDKFNHYSYDNSVEIKNKIISELRNNKFLVSRLFNAFPNAKDRLNKLSDLREQYLKKVKSKKD